MKKAAIIFLGLLVLFFAAFFPFWDNIYNFLNNKKSNSKEFSQLNFKSNAGIYDIYLDGKNIGVVEDKETKAFPQIEPKINNLKIVRRSDVNNFFYVMERNIEFIPSSEVIIEWEAGPTLESSSGIIKYFMKIEKSNGSELSILPFPKNATVELDSRKTNNNTFEILDTSVHNIRVSNGEGFETKMIPITMSANNDSKKVLKNLKLVIEVYLYKEPF